MQAAPTHLPGRLDAATSAGPAAPDRNDDGRMIRLPEAVRRHGYLAFVALLTVEMQREAWLGLDASAADQTRVALIALGMTVAFVSARRTPIASALAANTLLLLTLFVASPWDTLPAASFSVLVLSYAVGRRTSGRPLQLATLGIGAISATTAIWFLNGPHSADTSIGSAITQVGFAIAPVWLGATMRDRAALHRALRASADRAATNREVELERTVLEERARIAGELHDLIAHALSAVVIQAGGARRAALTTPDLAADAFAAVETTGRDALTEIRSMLGVLRAPGDTDPESLAPQPRVEHLSALIEQAPLAAELRIDGEPRPLPPSVDLTSYRVVQESLRAAAAAGARSADVTVTYEANGLSVLVVDDGRGPREPLATRERVRLYGGEVATEASRGEAGHRVRARLPIREAS